MADVSSPISRHFAVISFSTQAYAASVSLNSIAVTVAITTSQVKPPNNTKINTMPTPFPFLSLPPELRIKIYHHISLHTSYYPEVFDFRSPSPILAYTQINSLIRQEFLSEYHSTRWFTVWNIERPMERVLEKYWIDVFVATRMRYVSKIRFWTKKGVPLEVVLKGEDGGMDVRAPYEPLDEGVLGEVRGLVEGVVDGEGRLGENEFERLMECLRERGLLNAVR